MTGLIQKHYILTLSNRNLACSIRLNGIPVFTDNIRNRMDMVLHLNLSIMPGINELELILSVPPAMVKLDSDPISISGKVDSVEGIEEENSVSRLLNIEWLRNTTEDFPITLKYEFSSGIGYGPRIWGGASQIYESPSLVSGLLDYVQRLRSAMESRDFSLLDPFLAYKHLELSKSYAFPVSELKNDDKELFEKMFTDSDWGITDYDKDNLVIEYWAGNRIVRIQRPNGHELLRTPRLKSLDIIFSLPLQLALIEGQWQLIG